MILLCQGAGGLWTGLGGATPVGGQALIRSHGPPRLGGWGRQVIIRTMLVSMSAGLLGQTPPTVSDHVGEVFVGLSGHIPFQTSHDLRG